MATTSDHKIKASVGFTPRQTTQIDAEAKRLGLSFGDIVRRWIDEKLDAIRPTQAEARDPRAQKLYR